LCIYRNASPAAEAAAQGRGLGAAVKPPTAGAGAVKDRRARARRGGEAAYCGRGLGAAEGAR